MDFLHPFLQGNTSRSWRAPAEGSAGITFMGFNFISSPPDSTGRRPYKIRPYKSSRRVIRPTLALKSPKITSFIALIDEMSSVEARCFKKMK